MKALVLSAADAPLEYRDVPDPSPEDGQVVVELRAAAMNHRDVWITKGKYPGLRFPIILGSDGAGILEGKEVLINPSMNWGDDPRVQGPDYHILGLPMNGTFAEKVLVPKSQIHPKPAHLSWEEAAALPLAGLTAYRAVHTRGQAGEGEKVLISGIGGGVALFAFQFALATGAEVYVTSGSEKKIHQAMEMGAKGGANYREEGWRKDLKGQAGEFDLIIDSAGGKGFMELVKLAAPAARIVIYGGGRGVVPDFSPQLVFWKQLNILGSTMGSDEDFLAMLKLVEEKQIRPAVDTVFPLSEGARGFQRMDDGEQFGKIVFTLGS